MTSQRDELHLQVGEQHAVRLSGLGTAGYRWEPRVDGDDGVADVSAPDLDAPETSALGASADETFTIRALRPGVTKVRFQQRRPWDSPEQPPAEERVLELRVSDR